MHRDSERHKLFDRRTALLAGGKMLLLSVLGGRLAYLQIVEAERYRLLAESITCCRCGAGIVDRFGRVCRQRQTIGFYLCRGAKNVSTPRYVGPDYPNRQRKKRIMRKSEEGDPSCPLPRRKPD